MKCFAGLGLIGCALWAVTAVLAARLPFGLDYAEGVVWQQSRLLLGGGAYGPLDRYPLVLFEYPPLYHALVAGLVGLTGLDGLLLGRGLSIAATLACCWLVRGIVLALGHADEDRPRLELCAWLAALLALMLRPVFLWSVLMRVDMVEVALALGGFLAALGAVSRPRLVHLAAVLFVAALFTKQTALAAPVAAFAILLPARPRTALAGIGTAGALGLAGWAAMQAASGGGFFRHTVLYNINRPLPENVWGMAEHWTFNLPVIALALFGLAARWRKGDGGTWPGVARVRLAMAGLYLAVSWVTTLSYMKAGAAINYFVEWSFVLAVLAGLGLAELAARAERGPLPRRLAVLAWLPLLQVAFALPFIGEGYFGKLRFEGANARIVQAVRAADRPVVSDDIALLLRGGKTMPWEPFIVTELAHAGILDEKPFAARIRAREFAFFITEAQPGEVLYETRFGGKVGEAIAAAYPQEIRVGRHYLRFPAGPVPAGLGGL